MKNKLIRYLFLLILTFVPGLCFCQEKEETSRPVTGVYSFELGRTSVLATYLSPLKYSGTQFSLSGSWSKALPFNPENAVMQFDAMANFCNLLNPPQTARMVGLTSGISWNMSWRKKLSGNFQFTLGGGLDIYGGAYYLLQNSNNPVQAMANFSLNLAVSVSKHIILGKLPLLITERVLLPSLGVFFCPGYGETYYEIYLGNHKGLAHAGWWGNNFRIKNLLSFTLDFGRTAMSIGYRFEAYTQWANNLNTKIFSNSLVISSGTLDIFCSYSSTKRP